MISLVKFDARFASCISRETKAKKILRMCGIRMAALYLKNRGYSAEQAVTILLR